MSLESWLGVRGIVKAAEDLSQWKEREDDAGGIFERVCEGACKTGGRVFRARAAPQGMCDNLINALKLLAHQQQDVDSPVKMVVPGLLERKSPWNNGRAQEVYCS